jgi:hypothetical protein
MSIDERVRELGLVLPEPFRSPTGAAYPFSWVRVRGNRVYVSGHLPLQRDGTLAEPRGKVGDTLSIEQGAAAARLVGLAMLGSLQRELCELERITAWLRVLGGERQARDDATRRGHQRVLDIDTGGFWKGARGALAVRRRHGGVTFWRSRRSRSRGRNPVGRKAEQLWQ